MPFWRPTSNVQDTRVRQARARSASPLCLAGISNPHKLLGQLQECLAQFRWLVDDEREIQADEIASKLWQVGMVRLEVYAGWSGGEFAVRGRNFALDLIEFRLKLDLDRPDGGNGGKVLDDILAAIEVLSALKRLGEKLHAAHAVHAKHARGLAQAAVAHDIPVPIPAGDAIRLDLALRHLVVVRGIFDRDASALLHRLADAEQQRDIGPHLLAMWREDRMRRDSLEPLASVERQDAIDLRQRALHRHGWQVDLQPGRAEQAEHDRRRFLFSEEQRRQFKAGS